MSEREIFDAIQANAEQAADAERIAYEARQAERKSLIKQKRKNATKALLIRVVVGIALCAAMWLAEILGLMATGLVVCLIFAVFIWLAFYAGAWAQFMWCRGELLK